jgi:menaquinone reductase, molybdopterin-binding-like subunit
MDRRAFIKLTAISGTTAAVAGCGGETPGAELVRFLPDEDIVPGIAQFKPSVCPLCASGCGLTVRVMDADADVVRDGQAGVKKIHAAKKLEGSAAHPVNHGGLCARGQAAIQVTYHPDRIAQPLKRSGERGDGKYEAVAWDAALTELTEKLNAASETDNRRNVLLLAGPGGSARDVLLSRWMDAIGGRGVISSELFTDEVLRRANAISFDRPQLPTFDLANARHVISFGADFLGTWNSPVSQSYAYGQMRQGRSGLRGTFVQVESRMSQTGANADEWVPIKPGTDGVLALGLANVIIAAKLRPADAAGSAGAVIEGWSAGLASYLPEQVEAITGVSAARVERLARELAERQPSVAIVAGSAVAHTNGLFTALAVNALNALLGASGRPGGLSFTPRFDLLAATKQKAVTAQVGLHTLTAGILDGSTPPPQVLLVDGVNPVFTSPKAWKVADALGRAPFIVSFGSFLDETSALADLVLPDHSFLESWTASVPESGSQMAVVSLGPPAMLPLHDTRATPDVLLEAGRALTPPTDLPWQTAEEFLTAAFEPLPAPNADTDAWSDAQEKGGWWGTLPASLALAIPKSSADPEPAAFAEARFDGDAGQFPLHFLPYASSAFFDGSTAHLPWLQEMPDPTTSAMWSSWLEINPSAAAKLGIGQGDVVEVTSSQGTVRTAAMITPGIAPDLVAMPVGQGHRLFTRYASGRGANPMELVAPLVEPATGSLAWAGTRVKVARVGPPDGSLILFAGGMREHDDEHHER